MKWWAVFKKWFKSMLPDGDAMIAADMNMNGYTDFEIEQVLKPKKEKL